VIRSSTSSTERSTAEAGWEVGVMAGVVPRRYSSRAQGVFADERFGDRAHLHGHRVGRVAGEPVPPAHGLTHPVCTTPPRPIEVNFWSDGDDPAGWRSGREDPSQPLRQSSWRRRFRRSSTRLRFSSVVDLVTDARRSATAPGGDPQPALRSGATRGHPRQRSPPSPHRHRQPAPRQPRPDHYHQRHDAEYLAAEA